MLSNKEIVCPDNLLLVAKKKKDVTAGIVNAGKPLPMHSAMEAVKENLITPIFIGDKNEIQKCAEQLKWDISKYEIIDEKDENSTASMAAKLAGEGKVKIIVKGHIHTEVLIKAVLERRMEKIRPINEQSKNFIKKQETRIARTIKWLENNWNNYDENYLTMDQIAVACALDYTMFRFNDIWRADHPKLINGLVFLKKKIL